MTVVITPDIFSQIKIQTIFSGSTLGSKFAFQATPKPFKPVAVVTIGNRAAFAMVDKTRYLEIWIMKES